MTRRTPTAVDDLAERHLVGFAALDPVAATFVGVAGHEDRLTDYSPDGHAARADHVRGTLRELDTVTATDDVDRVTVAALRERLAVALDLHQAGLDDAVINNIDCPVQNVREVFDLTPDATAADRADLVARLSRVPEALAGYRVSLAAAAGQGRVPARRQVEAVARQATEFAAADGFFARLGGTGEGDPALTDRLRQGRTGAAAAMAELAGWLRSDLLPVARERDACGREEYALAARSFLGSRIDLDDTYAWGLDELARIEDRMARVGRGLAPHAAGAGTQEEIAAGIEVLDADPARRIEGAPAFRDWMQETADRAVADLDGTHFTIPGPLRRLVCRIAPSTSGAVYYTGPSEDLTRPGQMWWAVPAGTTSFATWRETSTVYHEGVPGHHLQVGLAVTGGDVLNRWRRLGSWVSGHGEGWALYAERLMEELGHLQDPGNLMGMLDAQAMRAARVVVDIGVHCQLAAPAEVGAGTWDAEKAWAFLRAHVRGPEAGLRFEWERYLGWPGQAISYKVGERVWLDLRAEVRRREGAGFDLKDFHRRALELGSVGLDVLRQAVLG